MQEAEIADEVLAHSAALVLEVKTFSKCFDENKFFGDSNNFRHTHIGYLMTCMAQIVGFSTSPEPQERTGGPDHRRTGILRTNEAEGSVLSALRNLPS
ncbi:hypothetical protein [Nocardia sp. NPDC050412]|uniref:hypothetical protein n=1 Tax=Nocardia sp. NPDC050412 TaxID=3364320 RepID=UPI00378891DB